MPDDVGREMQQMRRRGGMLAILRGRSGGTNAPLRTDRRGALTLETLEGRVVLSSPSPAVPKPKR